MGNSIKYDNIPFVFVSREHIFFHPGNPANVSATEGFVAGEPVRYLVSGGAGAKMWVVEKRGGGVESRRVAESI